MNAEQRNGMLAGALRWMPSSVKRRFSQDPRFRAEWGIELGGAFTIGGADFASELLVAAIEKAYQTGGAVSVSDGAGTTWELSRRTVGEDVWAMSLSSSSGRFLVRPFPGLQATPEDRLAVLAQLLESSRLDMDREAYWAEILRDRKLSFVEAEAFNADLAMTRGGLARSIAEALRANGASIEDLVPGDRVYFERLVGKHLKSSNIIEYASAEARALVAETCRIGSVEELVECLSLGWHSLIVKEIPGDKFSPDVVTETIVRALGREGLLTKVACVEFCLRHIERWPQIGARLAELIDDLRAMDAEDEGGQFQLFSALFYLTEGQVAHTRALADTSPFWRRLATLVHAGVLERELLASDIDLANFSRWARNIRSYEFGLQSLIDLREEPRWLSSMAQPDQVHAELFGRLHTVALEKKEQLPEKVRKALFRGKESRLVPKGERLNMLLPGPLEGNTEPVMEMPPQIYEATKERLEAVPISQMALWGYVNAMFVFKGDAGLANVAVSSVRATRLGLMEGGSEASAELLQALAALAAVMRNRPLADEVRVLVRAQLEIYPKSISALEYVNLALRSAAAEADIEDWAKFVGEAMIERAADLEISLENALELQGCIRWLRVAVPGLWRHVGRAEAFLEARATLGS